MINYTGSTLAQRSDSVMLDGNAAMRELCGFRTLLRWTWLECDKRSCMFSIGSYGVDLAGSHGGVLIGREGSC